MYRLCIPQDQWRVMVDAIPTALPSTKKGRVSAGRQDVRVRRHARGQGQFVEWRWCTRREDLMKLLTLENQPERIQVSASLLWRWIGSSLQPEYRRDSVGTRIYGIQDSSARTERLRPKRRWR